MKRFLFALLLCLPLVPCQAAEPSSPIDALLADLNTQQLANIPPSVATITVTPGQAEVYEPITATLDADIPTDSRVYGNGWTCSASVRMLPVSATVQHVWASPGKHTIGYAGVWVHTRKIVIVDVEGNEQTIESLLGIGMIDSSTSFTVGNGPDPPPPPPPPPPPVIDPLVTILEEMDDRSSGLEGAILNGHLEQIRSYLKTAGVKWQLIDDDQPAAEGWRGYLLDAQILSLPAIVVSVGTPGTVSSVFAFGADADETIAKLKAAGVK